MEYNWKAEWYELRNQMECKEAIHCEEINALKNKIAELEDEYKNKYVRRETLNQYMWERDTAISQLEELGLGFGQKINGVYLTYDKYNELLKYKWFLKLKMTIKSWFGLVVNR